jgi:hypothetical protein
VPVKKEFSFSPLSLSPLLIARSLRPSLSLLSSLILCHMDQSLSAKAGPSSIHSSRLKNSRKRSRRSSSPEQDESTTKPVRDRLPPALRAHHLDPPTSLSDQKDPSSSLRSEFQAKTPAPSDVRPPRLATLSPSQKQELHAHLTERYDLTREDLNDDATVDMLSSLVIGAGSFLQPDALLDEEEETVQSNRLDPVPSFSTMRSDGPISTLSDAFEILGLPVETIPLENWPALPFMKTSLTSAQVRSACFNRSFEGKRADLYSFAFRHVRQLACGSWRVPSRHA